MQLEIGLRSMRGPLLYDGVTEIEYLPQGHIKFLHGDKHIHLNASTFLYIKVRSEEENK